MESQKKRVSDEISGVHGGGGSNSNFQNDKKRVRRNAIQIERNFRCPIQNCEKRYGSENSLIQHVKIKHPDADIKAIINQINKQNSQQEQEEEGSQNEDSSQQENTNELKKKNKIEPNNQNTNGNKQEDDGEDDDDEEDLDDDQ